MTNKPKIFESIVVLRTETANLIEQHEFYENPISLIEYSAYKTIEERLKNYIKEMHDYMEEYDDANHRIKELSLKNENLVNLLNKSIEILISNKLFSEAYELKNATKEKEND